MSETKALPLPHPEGASKEGGWTPGKFGPCPKNLRSRAGVAWVYRVLKDRQDGRAALSRATSGE